MKKKKKIYPIYIDKQESEGIEGDNISMLHQALYDNHEHMMHILEEYPVTYTRDIIIAITANYRVTMKRFCGREYKKIMRRIWKHILFN